MVFAFPCVAYYGHGCLLSYSTFTLGVADFLCIVVRTDSNPVSNLAMLQEMPHVITQAMDEARKRGGAAVPNVLLMGNLNADCRYDFLVALEISLLCTVSLCVARAKKTLEDGESFPIFSCCPVVRSRNGGHIVT